MDARRLPRTHEELVVSTTVAQHKLLKVLRLEHPAQHLEEANQGGLSRAIRTNENRQLRQLQVLNVLQAAKAFNAYRANPVGPVEWGHGSHSNDLRREHAIQKLRLNLAQLKYGRGPALLGGRPLLLEGL
jgi:hypothetical protein